MAETLFDGRVDFLALNAQGTPYGTLLSKNLKEFGHTAGTENTDPQKLPKVKRGYPRALPLQQDDILAINLRLGTAATEAAAANALVFKLRIPVTIFNTRTRNEFEKTLAYEDFTAKMVSAASKVWAVATDYRALEYTVPAQTIMILGHLIQDSRVDSAISVYASYVA